MNSKALEVVKDTLSMVEWISGAGNDGKYRCPWCFATKPGPHENSCYRQHALSLLEEETKSHAKTQTKVDLPWVDGLRKRTERALKLSNLAHHSTLDYVVQSFIFEELKKEINSIISELDYRASEPKRIICGPV